MDKVYHSSNFDGDDIVKLWPYNIPHNGHLSSYRTIKSSATTKIRKNLLECSFCSWKTAYSFASDGLNMSNTIATCPYCYNGKIITTSIDATK